VSDDAPADGGGVSVEEKAALEVHGRSSSQRF
jgi:hypothetical protein